MAAAEAAAGSPHLVPRLVAKGWPLLAEVAPAAAAVVTPLARDPSPLVEALAATPQTFVHSNFKLDNLGTDDAGRVTLYRGVPYELPFGVKLYTEQYSAPVQTEALPERRQDAVTGHSVRSHDDAVKLLKEIERGQGIAEPTSTVNTGAGE